MASFRNPVQWLMDYFSGTVNGVPKVTEKSALQVAAFWYGVNRISANLGSLPLNLMQTLPDGGAVKVENDDRYWLMRDTPNAYQDPIVFKQAETKRAIMWGNSRSAIVGNRGNMELLPQPPTCSVTGFLRGEKWHAFAPCLDDRIVLKDDLFDEMMKNPQHVVMKPDSEVLHVQGFGDGIEGLSLIEYAANTLQISLSADKNTVKQNTKGFAGKLVLESPEGNPYFNEKKNADEFLADWEKRHGRDGDAEQTALLRNGLKLTTLNMSNKDAEFVEQKKLYRQDIALFLLLESILGDDSSVSYNSLEQKTLAYLINCLGPWLKRWEQQAGRKLLTAAERRRGMYFVFNEKSLLRMDSSTSAQVFATYLQNRVMNPNEVRIKLDMQPYDGGDSYENPNITPGTAGATGESTVTNLPAQSKLAITTTVPSPAIVQRLQHMMDIEEKRVKTFLARKDSFEQIDEWYEKWLDKLGSTIEQLGGDWILAQNHCVASLNYIKKGGDSFSLTGSAEQLAEQIEKETQ